MKRRKILCAITSVLMTVLLVALSASVPIGATSEKVTTSNSDIFLKYSILLENYLTHVQQHPIKTLKWLFFQASLFQM